MFRHIICNTQFEEYWIFALLKQLFLARGSIKSNFYAFLFESSFSNPLIRKSEVATVEVGVVSFSLLVSNWAWCLLVLVSQGTTICHSPVSSFCKPSFYNIKQTNLLRDVTSLCNAIPRFGVYHTMLTLWNILPGMHVQGCVFVIQRTIDGLWALHVSDVNYVPLLGTCIDQVFHDNQ